MGCTGSTVSSIATRNSDDALVIQSRSDSSPQGMYTTVSQATLKHVTTWIQDVAQSDDVLPNPPAPSPDARSRKTLREPLPWEPIISDGGEAQFLSRNNLHKHREWIESQDWDNGDLPCEWTTTVEVVPRRPIPAAPQFPAPCTPAPSPTRLQPVQ
eukprot:NODE_11142_length_561_cov_114.205479_g10861_i0.p1 GENE.NODE_11142_length_561_cov_114.205479_g10861_i0~~NODE_11142_length_561_cov_114.205479_g10861_i0.p1  ORF type:complete len:156 (-),score=9.46 NODE_11142_length_561_cov_114.205479_g10861_i0:35-502(-)